MSELCGLLVAVFLPTIAVGMTSAPSFPPSLPPPDVTCAPSPALPAPSQVDIAGLTFVPHTNAELPVNTVLNTWNSMHAGSSIQPAKQLLPLQTFSSSYGLGPATTESTRRCYQHSNFGLFYWPHGNRSAAFHNRTAMLEDLRAGVQGLGRQFVVLHPEIKSRWSGMSYMDIPEYVFEGVRAWTRSVPNGTRVLLVQPRQQDGDVVHTIAQALGSPVEVVPVGRALENLPQTVSSTILRNSRAYSLLEAACIYSHVYGRRYRDDASARLLAGLSSSQTTQLLDAAHCVTQALQNGTVSPTFRRITSGAASWFVNRKQKEYRYERWGSSTEAGIGGRFRVVAEALGHSIDFLGNTNKGDSRPTWRGTAADPVDFMLKRSMASGPGPDDYFPSESEVLRYHTWMKFDYQYDKDTSRTGDWNAQCVDQSYYSSPWSAILKVLPMRSAGQKVNFFPMRWFIAIERTLNPDTPVMSDRTHLSSQYLKGVASGILTLLSGGRCFVPAEPSPIDPGDAAWQGWHAQMTGYKLAHRFATLSENAPCFQAILPSGLDLNSQRRVDIRFGLPPNADVIVRARANIPEGVNLRTSVFAFGPTNYSTLQYLQVSSTGTLPGGTTVEVWLETESVDSTFNGLREVISFNTGTNTDPACGLASVNDSDISCYLARYQNLSITYGSDFNAARCDWVVNGSRFGRQLSCGTLSPTTSPTEASMAPTQSPTLLPSTQSPTLLPSIAPIASTTSPSGSSSGAPTRIPTIGPIPSPAPSTGTPTSTTAPSERETTIAPSSPHPTSRPTAPLSTAATDSRTPPYIQSTLDASVTSLTSSAFVVSSTTNGDSMIEASTDEDADTSTILVLGIVLGSLMFLAFLVVVVFALLRKRRNDQRSERAANVSNPVYDLERPTAGNNAPSVDSNLAPPSFLQDTPPASTTEDADAMC